MADLDDSHNYIVAHLGNPGYNVNYTYAQELIMSANPKILRRISSEGQITIPTGMLADLGLAVGDHLCAKHEGSKIILTPVEKPMVTVEDAI